MSMLFLFPSLLFCVLHFVMIPGIGACIEYIPRLGQRMAFERITSVQVLMFLPST
jgi:hypothetical protein